MLKIKEIEFMSKLGTVAFILVVALIWSDITMVKNINDRLTDIERENTLIKEQVVRLYDYVYERNTEE